MSGHGPPEARRKIVLGRCRGGLGLGVRSSSGGRSRGVFLASAWALALPGVPRVSGAGPSRIRRLPARFIWAVSGMAVFVPTAANAVNGARRGGLEPAEANGYRSGVLGLVSKGDLQEKGHD